MILLSLGASIIATGAFNLALPLLTSGATAASRLVGTLICSVGAYLGVETLHISHGFRCRAWAFLQGWTFHVVCAGMLALVIGASAIFLFPADFALVLTTTEVSKVLGEAVLVLVAYVLALLLVGLLDRPHVSPVLVHYVLKRVAREGSIGELAYTFPPNTPGTQIRAQCRVLAYLATHREQWALPNTPLENVHARFHFWQYHIHPDTNAKIRPTSAHRDTPDEARIHEEQEFKASVEALIHIARDVYDNGRHLHLRLPFLRWWSSKEATPLQFPTEKLYAERFFGNKLDRLFNGGAGIKTAGANVARFTTLMVKGQPGAGKSTLALQLCVTLARQGNICLYYSLEEEREGLLQSARDFGWNEAASPRSSALMSDSTAPIYHGVRRDTLRDRVGSLQKRMAEFETPATLGGTAPLNGAVLVSSLGNRAMHVDDRMWELHREWDAPLLNLPRCVVIDSLEGFANAGLDAEGKTGILREQFLAIKDFFRDRCEWLVLLVEDDGSARPGYADFVSDVVIRLGRREESGYVILTAEVLKARNQQHALGAHQIKIRSRRDFQLSSASGADRERHLESGVLVFPSLDYLLSQSRALPVFDRHTLSSGFTGLDLLLGINRAGGLRRQSATALLGPGSTGKSLLAMNFLIEGVRENKPALLLSLRDDEGLIKRRPNPQQIDRMNFTWVDAVSDEPLRRAENIGTEDKDRVFHRIEWYVDGIAAWLSRAKQHDSGRNVELPYLFKPTTSKDPRKNQEILIAQRDALAAFLSSLVPACPTTDEASRWKKRTRGESRADGWTPQVRRAFEAAFNDAWRDFEATASDWLTTIQDPRAPQATRPQQLYLRNVEGDEGDPPPTLRWESPVVADESGHLQYDTHHLEVRAWRPGRIAPEDFVDWLLRKIGSPNDTPKYGRVVFDDVS